VTVPFDPAQLAAELDRARREANPIPLLTARFPELTWDDARAVARAGDALRIGAGETRIGYKLGWTSAAMREALGIDRPNWGTLWQSQVAHGSLDLDSLIHPKVEPELVYRCGVDFDGEATAAAVAAAPGSWALGLEVVDPRWPSFDFDLLDNTADNSSCAQVAIGEFASVTAPAEVHVEFSDGASTRSGEGSNAMGDPCEAVAWLARSLAGEGSTLRAGDIVFTGGLTAPYDVGAGTTYSLVSGVLSGVELTA
jgi:2-keto-4-pentenoate hydratase